MPFKYILSVAIVYLGILYLYHLEPTVWTYTAPNKGNQIIYHTTSSHLTKQDLCTLSVITCENPVITIIKKTAKDLNYQDTEYLINLAYCESRLDPKAINDKNNHPSYSRDRGLFQFNDFYHSEVKDDCAFDPVCATTETIKLLNQNRHHEWICDRLIS